MSSKVNWTATGIGLLAALLLVTANAGAAISYVGQATSGVQTSTNQATITNFNMTGVDFVIAFVDTTEVGGQDDAVVTRTIGGQTMQPVPNGDFDSHNSQQYVRTQTFYYSNPATGGLTGNQNIVVTTTTNIASVAVNIIALYGVDRTNPIQASASNFGWNVPIGVTLNTTEDGSWVVFSGVKNGPENDAPLTRTATPALTTTAVWATASASMTFTGWYGGPVANAEDSQYVAFDGVDTPQRGVIVGASLRPRDTTPPQLITTGAIVRADANPTNAAQVNWTVTFTEAVTGVTYDDFNLNPTVTGANIPTNAVTPASGPSAVYNVLVNTGTGEGSLQLNLTDNDSIIDLAGNPLGGPGTGQTYNGQAYEIDKTAPINCTVNINGTDTYTNNESVTLTTTSTGATQMRFINGGGSTWSSWEPVAATRPLPWLLILGDGSKTVNAEFRDAAGNVTTADDSITLDKTPPTGTIDIAGVDKTSDVLVTLFLSASDATSGVTAMQFGTDGVNWDPHEPYATTRANWPLTGDDGEKVVWVRFWDGAGNSYAVYDTIILDRSGPDPATAFILINDDAPSTTNPVVSLTLSAVDLYTPPEEMTMYFSNDNSTWDGPYPYATSFSPWTLAGPDGTNLVYVRFVDNLGNETPKSDDIELDTGIPTGEMTLDGGAAYTNDLNVDVLVTTSDTDVDDIELSNDGAWSDNWQDYDGSVIPFGLAAGDDGERTVYARLRDDAGNISADISQTIILDTGLPQGSVVINDDAPFVNNRDVTLTLSAEDADGTGVEFMRFRNDPADDWSDPADAYSTTKDWVLAEGDDGPRTVYALFIDRAGNEFEASDSVELDTTLPSAPRVYGPEISSNPQPTWHWESNGGGNGHYRFQMNGEDGEWQQLAVDTDTMYTPPAPLADGTYTLYVQERDAAYNWSLSGSWPIVVDRSAVTPPVVDGTTPTNQSTLHWTWVSGGSPFEVYRYQVDAEEESGWTETPDTFFDYEVTEERAYTLNVQQQLGGGEWTPSGSFAITYDVTPPGTPVVTVVGCTEYPCITSSRKPTWEWTSGGGGTGMFQYQRDETGWSDPTEAISFTPADDLSEGEHTLYVREVDLAGNWSEEGSATVDVHSTPAGAPIVSSPDETRDQQPTWTWVSTGGSGNFRYQMNSTTGAWTETEDTEFTPTAPLDPGLYTLYVEEANVAGVWSAPGSHATLIDLTAPGAPVVTGPGVTSDNTPTWTWISGGGGNGMFRFQLDTTAGAWTETEMTEFTPAEGLNTGPHVLYVQERDNAGNWSASGSWSVSVQPGGPEPPVVSGLAVTNDLQPRWTWVGGGNGNGRYRYQLGSEAGAWQMTTAISFRPAEPLTDGAYTLYVQEQDSLGAWSQSGEWTIVVDTVPPAPPILSGATPVRTKQPTWTWTSSGDGAGVYRVQMDGEDDAWTPVTGTSFTPPLPLEKNAHTLYAQEADAAGNWSVSSYYTIVISENAVLSPIVTGETPTEDNTPTWTWEAAPDSGGNGVFSYSLDGGDWVSTSELEFTPETPLQQGDHTLEVRESDQFGEWSWPGSFTIMVTNGLPVITILGDETVNIAAGGVYTDAGATAVDADGLDITNLMAPVVGLPIDTNVIGTYFVRYNVTDNDGNRAPEAVRTVNVVSGVTEVDMASPMDGATLYMPAQGNKVLVALTSVAPEGTDSVTYTFDDTFEVGTATAAPWLVVLEIVPSAELVGAHQIDVTAVDGAVTSTDTVTFNIAEIPADADLDANGIPDSPFDTLAVGDIWAADGIVVLRADGPTPITTGAPYVIALENPANVTQRLFATVSPSVLAPVDLSVIVLKAANSLVALLGADQAAAVADPPEGYAVADSFYGTVNVAVTEDGELFWNLEGDILADYPVFVTAQNNLTTDIDLLVHPAILEADDAGVFIEIPEAAEWGNDGVVELNVVDGAATATLKALGLVAAFEQAAEGEGEGDEDEPHGCFAANLQPPTNPRSGDGIILLLAVALMLPVLKLRLRTNPIR